MLGTPSAVKLPTPIRWLWRNNGGVFASDTASPAVPLLEQILQGRDLGGLSAEEFLAPHLTKIVEPFQLKDMDRAAQRVVAALRRGEKIVIFGDYDADGATATALLVRVIRFVGGQVDYYIPHRIDEGYGLNVAALEQIAAEGAALVVTVDTGISGLEAAQAARELGLDLIITDHHQPGPCLPEAVAVVNPNRHDCDSPTPGLAGVGVAFKLAHAVLKTLDWDPAESRKFLGSVLELVAIGSVADFAPLTGENRVMVSHGLQRLGRTESVGLRALMNVAAVGKGGARVTSTEIGFQIGPRINAAGRTSAARVCVELLTTDDGARAEEIALELEAYNRERRRIELGIVQECLDLLELRPELSEAKVLVLSGKDWHPGVIGIVAARILQKYWRPTIVLSEVGGIAKGSARSIPGYDIFQALSSCSHLMDKFGGHPAAAGMTLSASRVVELREALNQHAEGVLNPEDLMPQLLIDAVVEPGEVTRELVASLSALEPFGQKNPEPMLAMLGVTLTQPPRALKEKHLKLTVDCGNGKSLAGVGWNMTPDSLGLPRTVDRVDIAFQPFINTFSGSDVVEVRIQAIRPAMGNGHG